MGDMAEEFREIRRWAKAGKRRRCKLRTHEIVLAEARPLAAMHGITLTPDFPNAVHYQLRENREGGWIINLYPTTGRIVNDAHRPGPRLGLPRNWTLLDAVKAAICD